MKSRKTVIALLIAIIAAVIAMPIVVRNWSNFVEKFVPGSERIARARDSKGSVLIDLATRAGLKHPVKFIFLRAFKRESELEVWGADSQSDPMKLLKKYRIAALSGKLGPKRKEGDKQVPEGCYKIEVFNPNSSFHLSLGLNYPNQSDRVRSDSKSPGSDIYIHGDNRSIGCLAMTDEKIDEIYLLAADAFAASKREIPVHIFPTKLTHEATSELIGQHEGEHEKHKLWRELEPIFTAFEITKRVPIISISQQGEYETSQ